MWFPLFCVISHVCFSHFFHHFENDERNEEIKYSINYVILYSYIIIISCARAIFLNNKLLCYSTYELSIVDFFIKERLKGTTRTTISYYYSKTGIKLQTKLHSTIPSNRFTFDDQVMLTLSWLPILIDVETYLSKIISILLKYYLSWY